MSEHNIYDFESGVLWKDDNFDIASYRDTGVAPPDVVTIPGTNIQTVAFDGNAITEDIEVCRELNHDYQEKTPLSFHVHWYPTTTASGNVKWQLEYWVTNQRMPETVVSGTMSVVQATRNVAWRIHTAQFPDLNLAPLDYIGSQIHFRFFRNPGDAQDTYDADAAVATMGWHYKTNSRGSAKMISKT